MGVNLKIPILELSWQEIQQAVDQYNADKSLSNDCNNNTIQVIIADGNSSNISYNKVDFSKPTLLVIGSEAFGVSESARSVKNVNVIPTKIPMFRDLESFNAAIAGSILLAEAAKQKMK